ncbi:MAG: peptide deformylase [Nitrospirae bacterium]|nr:peptide deformylase [Nitrospirota bacterium]
MDFREEREKMAVLKIIEYPDPILREKSRNIEKWDEELNKLIRDMMDTLDKVPGLGLAAVQVGVPVQMFVYDANLGKEQKNRYAVVINPEIVFKDGEIKDEEGCLSIPDYRDSVVRAAVVRVKIFDGEGNSLELGCDGLLARLFQHEIDHLNGILFIDRLSSLKKSLFLRRMRKLQKQSKGELSAKS